MNNIHGRGLGKRTNGVVRDVEIYLWLAHAPLVRQGEKSQSLYLIPVSLGYCVRLNCYLTYVDG